MWHIKGDITGNPVYSAHLWPYFTWILFKKRKKGSDNSSNSVHFTEGQNCPCVMLAFHNFSCTLTQF